MSPPGSLDTGDCQPISVNSGPQRGTGHWKTGVCGAWGGGASAKSGTGDPSLSHRVGHLILAPINWGWEVSHCTYKLDSLLFWKLELRHGCGVISRDTGIGRLLCPLLAYRGGIAEVFTPPVSYISLFIMHPSVSYIVSIQFCCSIRHLYRHIYIDFLLLA